MVYKKRIAIILLVLVMVVALVQTDFLNLGMSWEPSPYEQLHIDTTTEDYYALLEANTGVWGLGNRIKEYVTNDRPYDWYVDQGLTGTHSGNNCGPSTVIMAAKWYDENFSKSPKHARLFYRPFGGWWYATDISASLKRYKVKFFEYTLKNQDDLMTLLRAGHIIVVNNTMGGIPRISDHNMRIQRFYDFSSGHYFIVKGFVTIDQKTYFEVHDPNSWSLTYEDGQPKGKNRYYRGDNLIPSIINWYDTLIVIQKPN
jgi:hypothetical protein